MAASTITLRGHRFVNLTVAAGAQAFEVFARVRFLGRGELLKSNFVMDVQAGAAVRAALRAVAMLFVDHAQAIDEPVAAARRHLAADPVGRVLATLGMTKLRRAFRRAQDVFLTLLGRLSLTPRRSFERLLAPFADQLNRRSWFKPSAIRRGRSTTRIQEMNRRSGGARSRTEFCSRCKARMHSFRRSALLTNNHDAQAVLGTHAAHYIAARS